MKILKDKTAAITGAASGIGRALAINLAKEGCHLALADIDTAGLRATAALIREDVRVSTHAVDVSNRNDLFRFADEAVRQHGGVDLIINNAGVALGDFLETVPLEDFEWLMGINFWGVVYGTTAFLPVLRKRPEGHIVNVSSIYGILPSMNSGTYCAAKFAVRGYTETLAQEMLGTPIRVSCVYPGGIKTNIARGMRFNRALHGLNRESVQELYESKLLTITPDQAAKIILSGIRRDRSRIIIGIHAKLADLAIRLFPIGFVNLSARIGNRIARYYAGKQP